MTKGRLQLSFNTLYDETSRKTLRYITAKCGNPEDIRDIFQETYMEVAAILQKRGEDYVRNAEALVLGIAKQKLYRYYKKAETEPLPTDALSYPSPMPDTEVCEVEEAAVNSLLLAEIRGRLREKSPEIQKVFYMYYALDMTIPAIAKALSVKESTVKNRLYRTLAELRKLYL